MLYRTIYGEWQLHCPIDFVHLFAAIEAADTTDDLSEYEALTLMAFAWPTKPCAMYGSETGLGGRLDATNVVPNSLAIITDIGLDHTNILGPTIRDITTEKRALLNPTAPLSLIWITQPMCLK